MSVDFFDLMARCSGGQARVRVTPHGAHVMSWKTGDGVERLFLSSRAEFRSGVAIRGGVPIIFPQFAALGPVIKHGFARINEWKLAAQSDHKLRFSLSDSTQTLALWPFKFEAGYEVELTERTLSMTLSVRNTDSRPFSFTTALHTYLRVLDVRQVVVSGLQGCRYRDSVHDNAESIETNAAVRFAGEVDRIYFSTSQPIVVDEPERQSVRCTAQGFEDTVVWNPGAVLSQKLSDLDDDGYLHMVCIEAAQIGTPVTLQPGDRWRGAQKLAIE